MSGFDDFAEGFAQGFVPAFQKRLAANDKLDDDLLRPKKKRQTQSCFSRPMVS
jgi:hypothetical protein